MRGAEMDLSLVSGEWLEKRIPAIANQQAVHRHSLKILVPRQQHEPYKSLLSTALTLARAEEV